jgi:hypothetical protein
LPPAEESRMKEILGRTGAELFVDGGFAQV